MDDWLKTLEKMADSTEMIFEKAVAECERLPPAERQAGYSQLADHYKEYVRRLGTLGKVALRKMQE
jgi:hypothetical protein